MTRAISLKEPGLRHARAGEHLADIGCMVETIRAEHKIVIRQGDTDPPEEAEIPPHIGDRLSVRIGEHIYNLRAALDYLVYELSGHKSQTQFPIEKDSDGFNSRKTGHNALTGKTATRHMHGVSTTHCDLIETVQPYWLKAHNSDERANWTGLLQSLSNEDKHRRLVALNGLTGQPVSRSTVVHAPTAVVHTNRPSGSRIVPPPTLGYVEVHVDFSVEVALKEGFPAYQTLQELQAQVGDFLTLIESTL